MSDYASVSEITDKELNSRLKTIDKQTFKNQQDDRSDVKNNISNTLINELSDSKVLDIFIIRSEFRDFEARFEKHRKHAPFNLSAFDN